jgi:large subunit ribosomal protein L2
MEKSLIAAGFQKLERLGVFSLTSATIRASGKNVYGRTTSYHRGGGVRRRFRIIDLERSMFNIPGFVIRYEYDYSRSGHIALLWYSNGFFSYILAPSNLFFGSVVMAGFFASSTGLGNHMFFNNINQGSRFFNVYVRPLSRKVAFARAAGSSCLLLAKNLKSQRVTIRLPSGEHRVVSSLCQATLGVVSNLFHKFKRFQSAGSKRRCGSRPVVRGTAMNAIDHPHGGGAGKTAGGRPSVSPWGFITKGKPTISKKKRRFQSSFVLQSRKLVHLFFLRKQNEIKLEKFDTS